jgi:hypothetical protein
MSSISIRRIIKITNLIQDKMGLDNISKIKGHPLEHKKLLNEISQHVKGAAKSVERIIAELEISPADLAIRSRRAYQWLKFLSDQANLEDHLQALIRIDRLLPNLPKGCQKGTSHLSLSFYHISPLYKYQKRGNIILATIQECFIIAPDQVLRAILMNTLCSPKEDTNGLIREFASDPTFQEKREDLEYLAIPPGSYSSGKVHDLQISFNRVNNRYFNGCITQPHLRWSKGFTRRKFGDFQGDINTITISRSLDRPQIPIYVLDYVMYHELLHKKLGAKQVNSRRYTHTPEFRKAERKFDRFKDAQKILSSLSRKRI